MKVTATLTVFSILLKLQTYPKKALIRVLENYNTDTKTAVVPPPTDPVANKVYYEGIKILLDKKIVTRVAKMTYTLHESIQLENDNGN